MKKLVLIIFILCIQFSNAQVGIGTSDPNQSAQLEVLSSEKGLLIPRLQLSSTTDAATIKNGNVESLLIYNTVNVTDVVQGFYYWGGTKWEKILTEFMVENLISAGGLNGLSAFEVWQAQPGNAHKTIDEYFIFIKGADGAAGADGAKGDDGLQGAAGVKGDTGADGVAGADGAKGDDGLQGAAGAKGDTGAAGVDALTTLTNGKVYVGNGSNEAAEVSINGDATIANTGALTIANDAVTTVKILDGAITKTKLISTTKVEDNGKVLAIKSDGSGLEWKASSTLGVLYTEDFMEDNSTPKEHSLSMSVLGSTVNNFKVSLNGSVISPTNIDYDSSNGTNGSIKIIGIPIYHYDIVTVVYVTNN